MDNGGLRYGAVEGALRPPLPTATQSALHDPTILLGLRRPKIGARLTDPSPRNIIAPIRGSERWVAGIKSESRPASDRNRWPASFRNAWPASSESASKRGIKARAAESSRRVPHQRDPQTRRRNDAMAWSTPEVREVCVGMEVTSYLSAEM